MDPNVRQIIERSRTRYGDKKAAGVASVKDPPTGGLANRRSPKKISIDVEQSSTRRSPLKPKNFDTNNVATSQFSPKKGPAMDNIATPSPSDTIKKILSRESLETSVHELLNRLRVN